MSPRPNAERQCFPDSTNPGVISLMFASRVLGLVLVLASRLPAQSSSVPYDSLAGPTFHLSSPSYVYPGIYDSIREVDFGNLTLNVFRKYGEPLRYRLRAGRCETDDHPDHTSIKLDSVHYLSPEEADPQYALVLYSMNTVGISSSQSSIAQVFELSDRRLQVTQQIDWEAHSRGPWEVVDSFNLQGKTFVIHSAHYLPGDAHCCVSAVDLVTLSWNGRRFVQTDISTELSDYGRRKGKKLQP